MTHAVKLVELYCFCLTHIVCSTLMMHKCNSAKSLPPKLKTSRIRYDPWIQRNRDDNGFRGGDIDQVGTQIAIKMPAKDFLVFPCEDAVGSLALVPALVEKMPSCISQYEHQQGRTDYLASLADRDILFALLSHCLPWAQAATAAAALIDRYGSFADAIAAPNEELSRMDALRGTASALLKTIHSAALRLAQVPLLTNPILAKWDVLVSYLQSSMARDCVESVRCLFLNTKNRLIADEVLATGDPKSVDITPQKIVRRAIELNATALILVHNHPSGDASPSLEDIDLTRKISKLSASLGITLHDHLIIGRGCETSLKRLGLFD